MSLSYIKICFYILYVRTYKANNASFQVQLSSYVAMLYQF